MGSWFLSNQEVAKRLSGGQIVGQLTVLELGNNDGGPCFKKRTSAKLDLLAHTLGQGHECGLQVHFFLTKECQLETTVDKDGSKVTVVLCVFG